MGHVSVRIADLADQAVVIVGVAQLGAGGVAGFQDAAVGGAVVQLVDTAARAALVAPDPVPARGRGQGLRLLARIA